MGTMPIGLMGGMGGAQDDPLFNMSDTDYVGTMIAAQKKRDEEDERRKKEEEFKRQIVAQQQARQQQMAPLQQPLQQMIDDREQREGVGTARGTIIEMLRAIAQNKNYKPITDKIREEETKRHQANMNQLKAMDLEDKLTQKETELQMKNAQFGQMMAQKQAETQARWNYNDRLLTARKELTELQNKGKVDVANILAKARERGIDAEHLAMLQTGVGIADPNNPDHVTRNPDATAEQFAQFVAIRDKMKGSKNSQPPVVGYQTSNQSSIDAAGNTTGVRSTRKIFGESQGSGNMQGDVLSILKGQQQAQQPQNIMNTTNVGKFLSGVGSAAAGTETKTKGGINPIATLELERSADPRAQNMAKFVRQNPHLLEFGKARYLPNGYVDQGTIGVNEPNNRKSEVNDHRKNYSDADSFAGNFGQVLNQAGQMYLNGNMDKTMLTSNSKNLLVNAATSWINGRAQRLLKLGLKDNEYSDFINLRDANLQTLQEKLTAVGGKTLTESEQRIVKDYWPQTEFSDAENMLNAYARFNMLNKLKLYKMNSNMRSSGTEFLTGQILDKDGKVIGESASDYIDKSVKEIKALKDAGKIDAARKKIAELFDANSYFDRKLDQKMNPEKYQKRKVRI